MNLLIEDDKTDESNIDSENETITEQSDNSQNESNTIDDSPIIND